MPDAKRVVPPATSGRPRRRRLSPELRRQQIIDAARPLFADRPLDQVSTADVARAAGCSRALVHNYFGTIRDLFLAVVQQGAAAVSQAREPRPDLSLEERVAVNIAADLDIYEANRETFFAVMGHTTWSSDPAIDALASAATTLNIERSLDNAQGLIDDTPASRAALRAVFALSEEISRRWLDGEMTREQAETFLISSWSHAIREAIPALQWRPAPRRCTPSTAAPGTPPRSPTVRLPVVVRRSSTLCLAGGFQRQYRPPAALERQHVDGDRYRPGRAERAHRRSWRAPRRPSAWSNQAVGDSPAS